MNELEKIRNAFSKASVIVDKTRVIIMYNDKGLTVYQDLIGIDSVRLFSDMVDLCNEFSISVKKDKTVTLTFGINTGVNEAIFYQPIERQVNINDFISASEEIEPGEEFREFMRTEGAGREVDADFIADLIRFHDRKHPTFETISGYAKWKSFIAEQAGFLNLCRASDVNVMNYSSDFAGCVELTWYHEDTPVKYKASDKDYLVKALEVAEQVSFVLDVEEGYIEMNLFPES